MIRTKRKLNVLVAEDDPDDRLLTDAAFASHRHVTSLTFVEDGQRLMDYLHRQDIYRDSRAFPTPDLILLDLNMPRKDGREALAEIKSDPALRMTPIVILTTSRGQEDVLRSYDLGANSFIVKPVSFDALCDLVRCLGIYWLEVVELPAM